MQFSNLYYQRYLPTTNCNDFIEKIQNILIKKFSTVVFIMLLYQLWNLKGSTLLEFAVRKYWKVALIKPSF